jgi:anaerobic glycerol-3-phosphate dehydrogenase
LTGEYRAIFWRMPVTFDVAVIGGGIAGVSAALAAQRQGAATCVVRTAPGCTALISGGWTGPLRSELQTALGDAGYPLVPAPEPLAHQRGDLLRCEFAGATHATATVTDNTLVCGIAGLPYFNAHALARIWKSERPPKSHVIELRDTPAAGWTPASLAASLERSPDTLLLQLHRQRVTRVILPAVLGLTRTDMITDRLNADGIVISEALATTPSLPGWRLSSALERALAAHRITSLTGQASVAHVQGDRVQTVRYGNETISARSFVLATGKFVAGGVSAAEMFRESVFDLPIWLEQLGDVFTTPEPLRLTDPVRTRHQPLLSAGVHADAHFRPLNRAQDVVYQNVFVAGTVRAGWHTAQSGLGHCAENGWSAGLLAAA